MRRRAFAAGIALAAIAGAGALSWHFFRGPLRPWPDQGWQLQAAIRHSEGLGLTSQANAPVSDLEAPAYRRLAYFPPFLSLAASFLLRLGMGVDAAVKVINFAALAAGALGWISLAEGHLHRRSSVVLFGLLLIVADGALIPRGGTTDSVMWAILPWALSFLIKVPGAGPFRSASSRAAAGGALIALIAGFRWAGLFLVPGVCLFLLIVPRSRRLIERVSLAFIFAFPPSLAFVAISAANRSASGQGSYLDSLKSYWEWNKLATTFPIRSLTTIPVGYDSLLSRLQRAIDPSGGNGAVRLLLCGMPAIAMAALWAAGLFRARRTVAASPMTDGAGFRLLSGLLIAGYVLALAVFAVHFPWAGLKWSYLEEPRYFRPLLPLAALITIGVLESAAAWRNLAFAASWAGALYLTQAAIRWERTSLAQRDESWELVRFVDGLGSKKGMNVVFDNDVSDYLIRPHPNVVAYLIPAPEEVAALHARPATDVRVIRRVREKTALEPDPEFDARRFEALRAKFAARLEWRSSGGAYEAYRGHAGDHLPNRAIPAFAGMTSP